MVETLHIFWGDRPVGQLILTDQNLLEFHYSPEWLNSKEASPLSARLPLQTEPFADDPARIFFANLLPEGHVRSLIARHFGVSENNDFALLKALGGDCAGALSLWPDPQSDTRTASYEPLETDRLDEMIDHMESSPLLTAGEDLRLSLAGVQQKIPIMIDGDRFFLPRGSAASSHILKPDIPAFPHSALNEAFCMSLARKAGLNVPENRLWRGRHVAFLTARYDRRLDEEKHWIRLHQEDFCQALGYPSHRKYEGEGGPGLTQAFQLLEVHSTQPLLDKRSLLQGIVFNACIGNMDAHAKNFSMMMEAGTYRLAPLYDLLSTRVYGALSPKLAMRIGGQVRTEWLTRAHWEKLAQDAGVAPKAVMEIVQEIAGLLPGQCPEIRKTFDPRAEEIDLFDKLSHHITTTCEGLLDRLSI